MTRRLFLVIQIPIQHVLQRQWPIFLIPPPLPPPPLPPPLPPPPPPHPAFLPIQLHEKKSFMRRITRDARSVTQ